MATSFQIAGKARLNLTHQITQNKERYYAGLWRAGLHCLMKCGTGEKHSWLMKVHLLLKQSENFLYQHKQSKKLA